MATSWQHDKIVVYVKICSWMKRDRKSMLKISRCITKT